MQRIPTDKERDMAHVAVEMLEYCNAMMLSYLELVECLSKEDKYRHSIKRTVNKLRQTAFNVYSECCRVFGGEDSKLCDEFAQRGWILFLKIRENVGLSGSEKWYQIICTLSVLIEHKNRQLEGTYYFKQAEYLYGAERRLAGLGYVKNQVVGVIVDNTNRHSAL